MGYILKAGDCILAMDENKELIVEAIWEPKSSHCIDFSARYPSVFGILQDGSPVYCNRGFSFKDEGIKWSRIEETKVEKELKMQIRLIFDDILDEQPSQAIIEKVATYCRENDEYANGIVMESDVRENILFVLREGLRALEEK